MQRKQRKPRSEAFREISYFLRDARNPQEINEWMKDLAKEVGERRKDSSKECVHTPEGQTPGSPIGLYAYEEPKFVKQLGSRRAYDSILLFIKEGLSSPSVFSYTAALTAWAHAKHVSKDERQEEAKAMFDDMVQRGVSPTSYTLGALFHYCKDDDNPRSLLHKLRNDYPDVNVTVEVYNAAIAACSRSDNTRTAWQKAFQMFWEMKQEGITPDQQTFTSLLHACGKAGQLKLALTLFDECLVLLNSRQDTPDVRVWGALLNACAKVGDYQEAVRITEQMQIEYDISPNTRHVSALLSALSNGGQDNIALEIMEGMMVHEPEQFQKKQEELLEIRIPATNQTLTLKPVPLNLIALNSVVNACAQKGKYAAAKMLLTRMKNGEFLGVPTDDNQARSNFEATPVLSPILPGEVTYNTVLIACDDAKEAQDIVQEMRFSRRHRHGATPPSDVTYTNAITACRKAGDLEAALRLLETAEMDGLNPTVFMYSAAIWVAERCGDVDAALALLDRMRTAGCQPNSVSYTGVLSTMVESGQLERAVEFMEELKDRNVSISDQAYTRLAYAIRESGNIDQVTLLERIWAKMDAAEMNTVKNGPFLETVILTYGMNGRFDDALWAFDMIHGPTNGPCLRAILSACSLAVPPRWEKALEILHTSDVVEGAGGPGRMDVRALAFAIITCAKADEWEEGLNLLDLYGVPPAMTQVGDASSTVPLSAFNSLLSACGRCGKPDMALRLFYEMESVYKVKPDVTTYRSAAIACNQAQHDQRRLEEKGISPTLSHRYDSSGLQWWECALSLLRRKREQGIEGDVQTYSAVISACEAAGEWQRALGVLDSMMKESSWTSDDQDIRLNLHCFNAALSACEKGGAWIESLELYYRMTEKGGLVQPNIISLNCVLIALEKSGQKELAQSTFEDGVKNRIVNVWRMTRDTTTGEPIRAMDLHNCSVAMANAAVRSAMESLTEGPNKRQLDTNQDLVIIVGKGKGSESEPVLLPAVQQLLELEYNISCLVDTENSGRLIIETSKLQQVRYLREWQEN